jgi:Uma2 family endonuclease
LDIQSRQVHVFREPVGEAYQQETILNEDATISIVAFTDINVSLNQLFP